MYKSRHKICPRCGQQYYDDTKSGCKQWCSTCSTARRSEAAKAANLRRAQEKETLAAALAENAAEHHPRPYNVLHRGGDHKETQQKNAPKWSIMDIQHAAEVYGKSYGKMNLLVMQGLDPEPYVKAWERMYTK